MKERIAIIKGATRTPFCKAGGVLKKLEADDLGAFVVKELLIRTGFPAEEVDELIFGNVIQPPESTNIARVIAMKGGLPQDMISYTVNRNCASAMEAVTTAANKLWAGEADVIVAGGAESMSNVPILVSKPMSEILMKFNRAKTWNQRWAALKNFRPKHLAPVVVGLNDPLCGLSMGQTAEILAREFQVTREEQDSFALASHQKAARAHREGWLAEEIIHIPVPPKYGKMQGQDDGFREDQAMETLAKLRTVFDRQAGTVTAGNASQITDGAAAVLLMRESTAKEKGFEPMGYMSHYAYAALAPDHMGLGPVFATSKLLDKCGWKMDEVDLVEMNEAFAAQVLANQRAFASDTFSKNFLKKDKALGAIADEKINPNGGAIALGHPVGATGTRMITTLLNELTRRKCKKGLATLCIGGGQGAALALEAAQ